MSRVRSHLTFANVISCLALFVALGGGAYAYALQTPSNSIGTRQLKNGAVTNAKLAAGAVTGAKVANDSLTRLLVKTRILGAVPASAYEPPVRTLVARATDVKDTTVTGHWIVGPFRIRWACEGSLDHIKISPFASGNSGTAGFTDDWWQGVSDGVNPPTLSAGGGTFSGPNDNHADTAIAGPGASSRMFGTMLLTAGPTLVEVNFNMIFVDYGTGRRDCFFRGTATVAG